MQRADLVPWQGLYLEAQMDGFFHDLASRTEVVAVAEALPKERLIGHEGYERRNAPHVWMDPDLWALVVAETRET